MIHAAALLIVLAWLATARLTRLVNDDIILDRPRNWIVDNAPDKLAYFVTCPWCVSIWVGAAVASVVYAWPHYWLVQAGLIALSASMVTGLLAQVVSSLEEIS